MARRLSASSRATCAAVLGLAFLAAVPLTAHRRDEYLQAARFSIEPDRVQVELDLVPGMAVVDRVLPDIDANGDETIAGAEVRSYAVRVLASLIVDLDRTPLHLMLTGAQASPVQEMRRGEGGIRITAVAALPSLPSGDHRLHFRNDHRSDVGAYLANALVPATDRISIERQDRDESQRDIVITYGLHAGPASSPFVSAWLFVLTAAVVPKAVALVRRRPRRQSS
jgi:hypothetical protein